MKTQLKKVNRRDLHAAATTARQVTQSHKGSKLSFWCAKFLKLNEAVLKKHDKGLKKAIETFETEIDNFQLNHATEKDNVVVLDAKGNYQFNKDNQIKVNNKIRDINPQMEKATDDYLEGEVVCRIFLDEMALPEDLPIFVENNLNGFLFHNVNKFEEDLEFIESKEKDLEEEEEDGPTKKKKK